MEGPANASNQLGRPPQVEVKETPLSEVPAAISVTPTSINLYEFEVR